MRNTPLRVAVWSTGGIGSIAIRAIHRRPDLELEGVWVYTPEKVGKDAGVLANGSATSSIAAHGSQPPARTAQRSRRPIMLCDSTSQTFKRRQRMMSSGRSEVVFGFCSSGMFFTTSGSR